MHANTIRYAEQGVNVSVPVQSTLAVGKNHGLNLMTILSTALNAVAHLVRIKNAVDATKDLASMITMHAQHRHA